MNILQPPNDLDRRGQILTTLGDLYGLTIKQMMKLWGWKDYPKATAAFKQLTWEREGVIYDRKEILQPKEFLIYRVRRHGLGKETIPGDVYFLLSNGAKVLQEEYNLTPTFSFELNKAKLIRPGGLEHTLLVNETIIKLLLFGKIATARLRLENITHERSMRNEYRDAFKLYPDGLIEFRIKQGNNWNLRKAFVELEHTSARDKEKFAGKIRQYINLFEYKLGTYFNTDRTFVLVLVTDPEYVRHLRNLTETTLQELGENALAYRNWFCFGSFEQELSPVQFFCTLKYFNPFNKAPVVPFPGLTLQPSSNS